MRNSNIIANIALSLMGGALALALCIYLLQAIAGLPGKLAALMAGG